MIDSLEFAKLSGSGNDFVCIDNRHGKFDDVLASPVHVGRFVRALCHRGLGIGADGVIFACQTDIEHISDMAARFFEADGSEIELCGNGIACFVGWAMRNGWVSESETKILTPTGVVRGSNSDGEYVRVCIPDPAQIRQDFDLMVGQASLKCDFAVTGVPHVVTYVDDVSEVDITRLGPALRHHEHFQPRGANANFVEVRGEGEIAIRTWESGVEGETLACGTGSAVAAILAAMRFNWPKPYLLGEKPVRIHASSGDVLRVFFTLKDNAEVTDVCLETIVRFIYRGTVEPELAAEIFSR